MNEQQVCQIIELVQTCLFACLDNIVHYRQLSNKKSSNNNGHEAAVLTSNNMGLSTPTPNKNIFKQEPYTSKTDLVEISITALTFLVKKNKQSLATLLSKRILALKDIFLSSTANTNLEVNSKEKLSQLLCSIIMDPQSFDGESGDDNSIELAFRLALDHLSAKKAPSDWQWIILNRVLCQTTY